MYRNLRRWLADMGIELGPTGAAATAPATATGEPAAPAGSPA
jgi:hypothetical protein